MAVSARSGTEVGITTHTVQSNDVYWAAVETQSRAPERATRKGPHALLGTWSNGLFLGDAGYIRTHGWW